MTDIDKIVSEAERRHNRNEWRKASSLQLKDFSYVALLLLVGYSPQDFSYVALLLLVGYSPLIVAAIKKAASLII